MVLAHCKTNHKINNARHHPGTRNESIFGSFVVSFALIIIDAIAPVTEMLYTPHFVTHSHTMNDMLSFGFAFFLVPSRS